MPLQAGRPAGGQPRCIWAGKWPAAWLDLYLRKFCQPIYHVPGNTPFSRVWRDLKAKLQISSCLDLPPMPPQECCRI